MTKPLVFFEVRKVVCPSCNKTFRIKIMAKGKPPKYCTRCRSIYVKHPGAGRKLRRRLRAGMEPDMAAHRANLEIKEQLARKGKA